MADYDPLIPAANDNLSDSQGDIQNNFTQLNTIFDSDHFKYNYATSANRGNHRRVRFPEPTNVRATDTGSSGKLYAVNSAGITNNLTELFYGNATWATQITSNGNEIWKGGPGNGNGVVQLTSAVNGSMTLPNGLILNWGFQSVTTNTVVPFTTAYTSEADVFSILCTLYENSDNRRFLKVKSNTNTGFTVTASDFTATNITIDISWFSIGK